VLCSLDLLTETPAHAAAVLGADWDLLIVDEAHHLHWTPEDSGLDYDLVEALADQTPAVLLLTATPEQLGRAGHFGRLRLLDPERFGDYDAFSPRRPTTPRSPRSPAGCSTATRWSPAQQAVAARCAARRHLRAEADARSSSGCSTATAPPHPVPQHPRRHRRLPGAPRPCLPAAAPDGYVRADAGRSAASGARPRDDWTELDPRVPWLIETLRELRPAKVLLIAAHAETVLDLREHLHERAGIHAAVFHEGMEIVERDRAAAYFADPDEGTQVLLCSEIGSEGRNFQFAHHLVLFDLPLDPDLLEQRIGRLDRIGQTRTVEIHVPYLAGTAWRPCIAGMPRGWTPSRHCPAAPAVSNSSSAWRAAARGAGRPGAADALIAEAAALRESLNAELAAGRDRLLELSSHRPEVSAKLAQAMETRTAIRPCSSTCAPSGTPSAWSTSRPRRLHGAAPRPPHAPGALPGLPEDGSRHLRPPHALATRTAPS
jgi:ATP-dependent helicase HepA